MNTKEKIEKMIEAIEKDDRFEDTDNFSSHKLVKYYFDLSGFFNNEYYNVCIFNNNNGFTIDYSCSDNIPAIESFFISFMDSQT